MSDYRREAKDCLRPIADAHGSPLAFRMLAARHLNDLIAALAGARALLEEHGAKWVASRLADLEARVATGDRTALQEAVSEATGGMGSLHDYILCAADGDAISPDQEEQVNARLRGFVRKIATFARLTATEVGFELYR